MNSRVSKSAELATNTASENEENGLLAFCGLDLESALDCFSEIDTESSTPESNKIAYLEQLLRLHAPQNLSETQRNGRSFVLDMLRILCLLPSVQRAQEGVGTTPKDWDPSLEFKYLVYLFERTARPDLAEKVRQAENILSLDGAGILGLREWLTKHGLEGREIALIQPNFFSGTRTAPINNDQVSLHPMFEELHAESKTRNHDYIIRSFYGLSHSLRVNPEVGSAEQVRPQVGLEEALATVFETPVLENPAPKMRLKAYLIPNPNGEPMVALSYTND